jgi:hypothetical protein
MPHRKRFVPRCCLSMRHLAVRNRPNPDHWQATPLQLLGTSGSFIVATSCRGALGPPSGKAQTRAINAQGAMTDWLAINRHVQTALALAATHTVPLSRLEPSPRLSFYCTARECQEHASNWLLMELPQPRHRALICVSALALLCPCPKGTKLSHAPLPAPRAQLSPQAVSVATLAG